LVALWRPACSKSGGLDPIPRLALAFS
jgi:hypothetical protein